MTHLYLPWVFPGEQLTTFRLHMGDDSSVSPWVFSGEQVTTFRLHMGDDSSVSSLSVPLGIMDDHETTPGRWLICIFPDCSPGKSWRPSDHTRQMTHLYRHECSLRNSRRPLRSHGKRWPINFFPQRFLGNSWWPWHNTRWPIYLFLALPSGEQATALSPLLISEEETVEDLEITPGRWPIYLPWGFPPGSKLTRHLFCVLVNGLLGLNTSF